MPAMISGVGIADGAEATLPTPARRARVSPDLLWKAREWEVRYPPESSAHIAGIAGIIPRFNSLDS